MSTGKRTVVEIPPTLHKRVKTECVQRGVPMTRYVEFWLLRSFGDLSGVKLEDWYRGLR